MLILVASGLGQLRLSHALRVGILNLLFTVSARLLAYSDTELWLELLIEGRVILNSVRIIKLFLRPGSSGATSYESLKCCFESGFCRRRLSSSIAKLWNYLLGVDGRAYVGAPRLFPTFKACNAPI